MILVKKHYSEHTEIICLCDSDILGKKFEDELHSLDISKRFYEGEVLPEDKILQLITDNIIINILGKESIAFALKHNLIKKENILTIQNVPHAQVY